MVASMGITRKADRWVRKHGTAIILLTLILALVPSVPIFIYQEQEASCQSSLFESQSNANYRATIYRLAGGMANPVKIQECKYAVQFQSNSADSIHITACVVAVVTRANGTVEAPSQLSC
jgi:hypothetical protein